MKVTINDRRMSIFNGACVRDALRRAIVSDGGDASQTDDYEVRDSYGHLLDLDAPLHDGQCITYGPACPQNGEEEMP